MAELYKIEVLSNDNRFKKFLLCTDMTKDKILELLRNSNKYNKIEIGHYIYTLVFQNSMTKDTVNELIKTKKLVHESFITHFSSAGFIYRDYDIENQDIDLPVKFDL